jgi:hypothetical protein
VTKRTVRDAQHVVADKVCTRRAQPKGRGALLHHRTLYTNQVHYEFASFGLVILVITEGKEEKKKKKKTIFFSLCVLLLRCCVARREEEEEKKGSTTSSTPMSVLSSVK